MSKSDFRDNITDKVLEKIIGEFTINSILDKKITDLTEIEAKFFTQKNIKVNIIYQNLVGLKNMLMIS